MEEIFRIIYDKGFDDRQANQLLKLYADGYDLTYIEPTVPSEKLRQLRTFLDTCDKDVKDVLKDSIDEEQNIIPFIDLDFSADQIFRTLKLEYKEIDTTHLKQKGFSKEQFEILYDALSKKYDISWFANPNISKEKMKLALKGLNNSINLSKYIKNYNEDQCAVLLEALHFSQTNFAINISFLENEKLNFDQMKMILSGLKDKIDVSKYARPEFDHKKMAIILSCLREGYNMDWVNETYSAEQLYAYYELLKIDSSLVHKICNDKYNAGQLSLIKEALNAGKDIKNILNPNYSIERMNLILSSDEDIYKDLTIDDERLHLYRYGYIKDINDEYDIEQISKNIHSSIKKCAYIDAPFVDIMAPYKEPTYLTNGEEILEVVCVSDQVIDEVLYDLEYRHRFIECFQTSDAMSILRKNEKVALDLLNELNILKYNEENETIETFNLFKGRLLSTKSFDVKSVLSLNSYKDYFDENNYYSNSFADTLNNINMFLNYLGINIEDYYLIQDVFTLDSRPCFRLCVNLENINSDNIKEIREAIDYQAWELEGKLEEESYAINLYNNKGKLIDSNDTILFKDELDYILQRDYEEFYDSFACTLEECVMQINKENTFER